MRQASKRKRGAAGPGVDAWDKRTISGKEWIQKLDEDLSGKTTFAWTVIPDWVTSTLRSMGYDGVQDVGGKLGGQEHRVWVPFGEAQVKSATSNVGTFSKTDARISHEIVGQDSPSQLGFYSGLNSAFEIAPAVETKAFKEWFGKSAVVDAQGKPLVVYHGAQRSDRIGGRFAANRATSGPMQFFTESPELAGSYAKGKADTSLETPEDYAEWFLYKAKGRRRGWPIDQMWTAMSAAERAAVTDRYYRATVTDSETGSMVSARLLPRGSAALAGKDHWDRALQEARGNPIRAMVETWLSSGSLYDTEESFMQLLRVAGVDMSRVEYASPQQEHPGVFPVHLSIQNPLITSKIPPKVVDALRQASKRKRGAAGPGVDAWDKRTISGKEWIQKLDEDLSGKTTFAWTVIPDWVTSTLRSMGYDGVQDVGGKLGGQEHRVWVPFGEAQVKSATSNVGTFSKTDARISHEIVGQDSPSQLGFYSGLNSAVEKIDFRQMPPAQLLARLKKTPGVKQAEIEDTGLAVWLEESEGKVGKEAVRKFLAKGGVQIEEVVKREGQPPSNADLEGEVARRAESDLDDHNFNWISDDLSRLEKEAWGNPDAVLWAAINKSKADFLRETEDEDDAKEQFGMALEDLSPKDYYSENEWGILISEFMEQTRYEYLRDIREEAEDEVDDATKFAKWQLPGGQSYREVLLTVPDSSKRSVSSTRYRIRVTSPGGETAVELATQPQLDAIRRRQGFSAEVIGSAENIDRSANFTSPHWDEPNVLAHIRMNDRQIAGGNTLFVEEIQSDWLQKGKKVGFRKPKAEVDREIAATVKRLGVSNISEMERTHPEEHQRLQKLAEASDLGVPDAPFKKTESWAMLAFKRALHIAATEDKAGIAWTPGEVQADRYDLSKQVDEIEFGKRGEGGGAEVNLSIRRGQEELSGQLGIDDWIPLSEVERYVGKDIATKIAGATTPINKAGLVVGEFSGAGLKTEAPGMVAFYDKMLPKAVQKYVKKLDKSAKVGTAKLQEGKEVWHLPLTDKLKDTVLEGQPMYEIAGADFGANNKLVTRAEGNRLRRELALELVPGKEGEFFKQVKAGPMLLKFGLEFFDAGYRHVKAWQNKMREELGSEIDDHLTDIWDRIKDGREQLTQTEKQLKPRIIPAKFVKAAVKAQVRDRVRKQTKAAKEGDAPFRITPQELLVYSMEAQAKGAVAGHEAGEHDLKAAHVALLEYAESVIPEGEKQMLADIGPRIIKAVTPKQIERVVSRITAYEEKLAERAGLKISTSNLRESLVARAEQELKGTDLVAAKKAILEKVGKITKYSDLRTMGVAVGVLVERRAKRKAVDDFKKFWKKAGKGKYPKDVRAEIDELVDGFALVRSTEKTLDLANRLLQRGAADIIGETPQAMIDRARALLIDRTKPLLRDLSVSDIREVTSAIKAIIELSNENVQADFQRRAVEAEENLQGAIATLKERFPGEKYKSDLGEYDKDTSPGKIRQALGEYGLSSYDTQVAGLGGETGPLRKVLYDGVRKSHTQYLRLQQQAEDWIAQRFAKLGLDYGSVADWSDALKRPGLLTRGKRRVLGQPARTAVRKVNLPTAWSEEGRRVSVVAMTSAERISLLLHIGDPSTRAELLRQDSFGVVFGRNRSAGAVRLRAGDLKAISESATPEERAVAMAFSEYINDVLRPQLETEWLAENGFSLDTHQGYWPRRRAGEYRFKELNSAMRQWVDAQLDHMGILKARTGSRAPILVGDAFSDFYTHINQTSAYIAKNAALADAMRMLDSHRFKHALRTSVKHGSAIRHTMESTLKDYRGLDIMRAETAVEPLIERALKKAHVGALGLNPRIIAYQTMSLATAGAVIDWKYILRGGFRLRVADTRAEMLKWSPDMKARLLGGGHQILTPGTGGGAVQQFYGKREGWMERYGMGSIHSADSQVMYRIWEAAKAEGVDKGLSGDALMRYTADRAVQIVDRTQPTWDMLTIAAVQRQARKSPWMKLLPGMMFSSQRGKNANITLRALSEFKHSRRSVADYAKLVKQVSLANWINAAGIYGISYGFSALYAAIWSMMLGGGGDNDDDKGLKIFSGITEKMLGNWLIGGDVAAGALRGGIAWHKKKDAYRIADQVVRDNIISSAVKDGAIAMIEAANATRQMINDERYKKGPTDAEGLRERKAFYSWMRAAYRGSRAASILGGAPLSGPASIVRPGIPFYPKERSTYYKRLWRAEESGDTEAAAEARRVLTGELQAKDKDIDRARRARTTKANKAVAKTTAAQRMPLYKRYFEAIKADDVTAAANLLSELQEIAGDSEDERAKAIGKFYEKSGRGPTMREKVTARKARNAVRAGLKRGAR